MDVTALRVWEMLGVQCLMSYLYQAGILGREKELEPELSKQCLIIL